MAILKITDLDLRGISGLEVAREIHDRQPSVPVVVLGAADTKLDRDRATAAGAAEFWSKTQSQKQFTVTINRVIQAAKASSATRSQKPKKTQTATIFLARIRNILLFIFAPFFALGYIIIFPLVGLGALGWLAIKAARRTPEENTQPTEVAGAEPRALGIFKTVGMLIAVAFIGLAFGVIGPVFGFILVVCFAFEAWGRLGAKAIKASET